MVCWLFFYLVHSSTTFMDWLKNRVALPNQIENTCNWLFVSLLDYEQPGTTKISESSDAKPEIRDFFAVLQNKGDQIRSSLSESVYSKYLDSYDWPSWKFDLETWQLAGNLESETNQRNAKSCKVVAKINILHASIIKKDIGLVKIITKLAQQKGQNIFEL